MKKFKTLPAACFIAGFAIALPLVLTGCGGSQNAAVSPAASRSARATVTIDFPKPVPPSRLIPAASQSVRITIENGAGFSAAQVIARPDGGGAATATFTNLPPSSLTVTATAHENADGTGTVQAGSKQTVDAAPDQAFTLNLTMTSTIASVVLEAGDKTVTSGEALGLNAVALDAAGETILTASTWQWAVNNASASIDATNQSNAVLRGITPGTVTVTATETESGKTASVDILVKPTPAPTPTPTPPPVPVVAPSIVVSTINQSVRGLVRYDGSTKNFRSFTPKGDIYTRRFARAEDGTIYIIAGNNSRNVQVIMPSGTLGNVFAAPAITAPIEDIAVLPDGNVLVRNNDGFFVYDKNSGKTLSTSGALPNDFLDVYDMKIGPEGKLYAAGRLKSSAGYAVKRYIINANDTLTLEAQLITFANAETGYTNAITFTSDNKMVLTDLESKSLRLYDLDGGLQKGSIILPLSGFAQSAQARSVFTAGDEILYILDTSGVFRVRYTPGAASPFERIDGNTSPVRWFTDGNVVDIAVEPTP